MLLSSVVALSVLALAASTEVRECPESSQRTVKNSVQLRPCKKLPCRLKKGTDQFIDIEFTPVTDINDLKNKVSANVFGVNVPFIGVDGNSICDKVFNESGDKEMCPLKAGKKYIYKDSFPVLSFYPTINVDVHWSLESDKHDIVCFEVPAKIVQ
ncbi:ecdysteroid-regulated 16 kDa protein-like [Battus philenor]|uniref:ecdysteroid-regulated 16 kDa protein-like n=1 Tax=Battus philenor TaxID=42288 RepID=UPI0035CF1A90